MVLDIRIAQGSSLRTTPELAARALSVYPTLANHSCINNKGPVFGVVIEDTPLAHLFEHLIIAEQTALTNDARETATDTARDTNTDNGAHTKSSSTTFANMTPANTTFVGTTQRTGERTYRTEVSFFDDLMCLKAIRNALAFFAPQDASVASRKVQ